MFDHGYHKERNDNQGSRAHRHTAGCGHGHKAVFPKLPVTPNFIISMYCLAVLLVRPRIVETIGIGVVSAILAQLTTGAAVPFINFASEPIAIVVCYFLCRISFPKGAPSTIIRPAVVSFITTFVSGTVFVLILSFVLLARGSAARYVMIYTSSCRRRWPTW